MPAYLLPSGSMAAAYGLGTGSPTHVASELHQVGRGDPNSDRVASWWHPQSPLFWVGALLAVTLGAAAISGSGTARVGPVHAEVSAGAGK